MEERQRTTQMGEIFQEAEEETSSMMPNAEAVQEKKISERRPPLLAVTFVRKATDVNSSVSIEELCNRIYNGVFMNDNKLKFWVDEKLEKNCFLLLAREFKIAWIDNQQYWRSIKEKEKCYSGEADVNVAELLEVCWLDITGTFKTIRLSPKTTYEVLFLVKMSGASRGWGVPVNLSLTLPDGTTQGRIEDMNDQPKGKWLEIPAGTFVTTPKNVGNMSFSFSEKGDHWKSGLLFKGVYLLPKD